MAAGESALAGAAAGAVAADASLLAAVLAVVLVDAGALPEPLKSVAYQPEPFNWNPAAVNCFLKAGCEQFGHVSSGASDIFCNTSLANPQDSHL